MGIVERKNDMWWEHPLRIIQTNMQVKDTGLIEPRRLARQLVHLGANALVFNVGGIYAWYRSEIPFHTRNEHLPPDRDLLEEIIEACHAEGLRFIARFDFSKAEDRVYLHNPHWFVRNSAGEPQVLGARRPGSWSLLMSTCINGAYRDEAVALPVLEEALARYAIDGVFFNAPQYIPCYCEGCKRKYSQVYGEALPADAKLFRSDWASLCMRDNYARLRGQVKRHNEHIPVLVYYDLYKDNLFDRAATADILITEPHDSLSHGHQNIPEFWKPALSIKLGRSLPGYPQPLGIIHSCPGLVWRHTGLPVAEYRFWLCQVPAHGGSIWHSLTGIPDTIRDQRILDTVKEHNDMVKRVEAHMEGAAPDNRVALMWDASSSAEGWGDGFIQRQISFDVLLREQAEDGMMDQYDVIVIPEAFEYTPGFLARLTQFAAAGGGIVMEGVGASEGEVQQKLLGISGDIYRSEPLSASYLRFEGERNPLQKGMEQTEWIAFQGQVAYCHALPGTEVLATLVPPFSPPDGVGAPPERASIPVEQTTIPLAMLHRNGHGRVIYLPFSLSRLVHNYKLDDHYRLISNVIDLLLGDRKQLEVTHVQGLQVTLFRNQGKQIIHFVNGTGRRPLTGNVRLHDIRVAVNRHGQWPATRVAAVVSRQELDFNHRDDGWLEFTLPTFNIWEAILIE